jgi:hypothetical protein
MFTDAPPRKYRAQFLESDSIKTLDLPPNGELTEIGKRLQSAMKSDSIDAQHAEIRVLAIQVLCGRVCPLL